MSRLIRDYNGNEVEVRQQGQSEGGRRLKITHPDGWRWIYDVEFDGGIEVESIDRDGQHISVQLNVATKSLHGIVGRVIGRVALLSPSHQHHHSAG